MINTISLGPITIHMYGLMMALGFAVALLLCSYRGKLAGLNDDVIWGIFYCAIFGGLGGAKLLFFIVELPAIIKDPSVIFPLSNGFVVYGGIIGGILLTIVYCRIKKEPFLVYFDLVMPAVSLAQGFGRLGCFFAGCCYGRETDSWFHIRYWMSEMAPNGVNLIPTQLISAAGDVLICLFLIWYSKRKHITGQVAAMWMMVYGLGRFLVEMLRNDYRGSIGFLSTSQIISIGMILIGALLWFFLKKVGMIQPLEAEQTGKEAEEE